MRLLSWDHPVKKFNLLTIELAFATVALTIAVASLIVVTTIKTEKYQHVQNFWEENAVTAAVRDKQLSCLAINIYREAGYEPFEGKVAVAQVTMNRVDNQDFPNDVCEVVYQKSFVLSRTICQFSWYCDSTHRNRAINPKAYQESYDVAKRVLLENYRLPGLTDALYYHADYVSPGWDRHKNRLVKIGTHIFYSPKERQL